MGLIKPTNIAVQNSKVHTLRENIIIQSNPKERKNDKCQF
jgi:hypothetical protein